MLLIALLVGVVAPVGVEGLAADGDVGVCCPGSGAKVDEGDVDEPTG